MTEKSLKRSVKNITKDLGLSTNWKVTFTGESNFIKKFKIFFERFTLFIILCTLYLAIENPKIAIKNPLSF